MTAEPHTLSRAQVLALLEERDVLREQVRQLRTALVPVVAFPRAWGLSPTMRALLTAIRAAAPGVLHRERAMLGIYGLADDPPQVKTLDVTATRTRRVLRDARAGITFETVWGVGWLMDPDSCARFDAAVAHGQRGWVGEPVRHLMAAE